jgi:nucleoside-diphosphate-sugar epimerase
MIRGEKILVTGVTGAVAGPLAAYLARNNEVWGLARFLEVDDPARRGTEIRVARLDARAEIERLGIKTCSADIGSGDLSGVPDDFTYVLHAAFVRVPRIPEQFKIAYRINADGVGFVMQHCRKARAALLLSSGTVYAPNDDVYHAYHEDDPLGGAKAHWSPSSPVSKVIQEAVGGFCSRAFNLPMTIVRLFMPYGTPRLGPALDILAMKRGAEIFLQNGPQPQTPIHIDDLCDQLEAMLGSAGVPPLVTNWTGDEVISSRTWCEMAGDRLGIVPRFRVEQIQGAHGGFIGDPQKRRSITGACRVKFAEAYQKLIDDHHVGD